MKVIKNRENREGSTRIANRAPNARPFQLHRNSSSFSVFEVHEQNTLRMWRKMLFRKIRCVVHRAVQFSGEIQIRRG